GGSGFDLASYAGSRAGVSVSLLNFTAFGGDAGGDTLYNIEGLIGSGSGDSLAGDDYANRLEGGAGSDGLNGLGAADRIYGGRGSDFIVGGEGDDHLFGGDGNDQLVSGT